MASKRDPASIDDQHRVQDKIEAAAFALEVAVLAIIARRLGKISKDTTPAQLYAAMPEDIAAIRETINKGSKNIQQLTQEAMERMAAGNDQWAAFYYKAAGKEQILAEDHFAMSRKLAEKNAEARRSISAMCNTSAAHLLDENTGELVNIEAGYKRVVNAAATNMATGTMTGQQAISQAVKALSKSGLRVVYASGVTRNLYTAVATNVMDAYRVAMSQLRQIQGVEFGADGVEVSAHAESAPDHLPYQGRQYSYATFQRLQDVELSGRPLETGANCGHIVSPIIMGISSEKYTAAELREMERRSNGKVSLKGLSGDTLTMTRYQATQYQRQIETSIRKANERAYLMREAGEADAALEKAIKKRTAEYKRISAEAGVGTRMERTRAYVI